MRLAPRLRAAAAAAALAAVAPAGPAAAQLSDLVEGEAASQETLALPVVLTAEEVSYDRATGVVTASGDVEISQGPRRLFADRVIYDQRADRVRAEGDVSLLEPTGETVFASEVELTGDLREGVVRNLRILFSDEARLAANGAVRTGGNRTEARRVVYSPCRSCPEDPSRPLLWQLKADRVVYDQAAGLVSYRNVFFELFGVPIAYTPYFAHPDPTIDRKSGFLAPTIGTSSLLGFFAEVPYFWAIAPNRDATVAVRGTTDAGPVLSGEYRELRRRGRLELRGSVTRSELEESERFGRDEIRGHIEGFGFYDLDPTWRVGFDGKRATDDTYLRLYDFGDEDLLTSRAYLEGIRGRDYAAVAAYSFQGLRAEDDQGLVPIVAPELRLDLLSEPGRAGDSWFLRSSSYALTRTDGQDAQRFSAGVGWTLPYVAPKGDVYRLTASVRGDLYNVNDASQPPFPFTEGETGTAGRFVPELVLDWRYPFVRSTGAVRQLVEPIVSFAVSPTGLNDEDIPNEDSIDVEFDATNLFDPQRFPGLDRVEEGPRVSYGLRLGAYAPSGRGLYALVGQSYRLDEPEGFPEGSGLEDNLSDYVGTVTAVPHPRFNVSYRFRFDNDDLSPRRQEVQAFLGLPRLSLGLSYAFLAGGVDAPFPDDRQEVFGTARLQMLPRWAVAGSLRRDLERNANVTAGAGVFYEDECTLFGIELARRFTRDRDIEPETSITLRLVLKTLGEVGAPSFEVGGGDDQS
jgi:LPS-assembly protein